jgi:signal transduction histidine kinase
VPGARDLEASLRMLESAIARAATADSPARLATVLSADAHEISGASVAVTLRGADGWIAEGRDGRSVDHGPGAVIGWGSAGRRTGADPDSRPEGAAAPMTQRVPLVDPGRVVGSMLLEYPADGPDPDEQRLALVRALAAAAGPLAGRLWERAERGSLRGEAVRPADVARAERTRIARELHDGLIQSLYGMGLLIRTQAERTELPQKGRDTMSRWVRRIDALVDEATEYIAGLEVLGDAMIDLGAGIDAIAEEAAAAGLDVSTEVNFSDDARLPREVCHELLVVAREAASNTIRHAEARRVAIHVEVDPASDTVTLSVDDDGRGFETARHRPEGHGLDNMAARAAQLGGSLDVLSRRGAGTRLRLRLPAHPARPAHG